jgi:hypothetical protein
VFFLTDFALNPQLQTLQPTATISGIGTKLLLMNFRVLGALHSQSCALLLLHPENQKHFASVFTTDFALNSQSETLQSTATISGIGTKLL